MGVYHLRSNKMIIARGSDAFIIFRAAEWEIRRQRALIFLNPCLCYEGTLRKIKAEFRLDHNEAIRDILVKADGSRHYQCDCEEDMDG